MYSANLRPVQGPVTIEGLAVLNEQQSNSSVNPDLIESPQSSIDNQKTIPGTGHGSDLNQNKENEVRVNVESEQNRTQVQNSTPEQSSIPQQSQILDSQLPTKTGYNKKFIAVLFVLWLMLGGYYFMNQNGDFFGANIFGIDTNDEDSNSDITKLPGIEGISESDVNGIEIVDNTGKVETTSTQAKTIKKDEIDDLFISGKISEQPISTKSPKVNDSVVGVTGDSDGDTITDLAEKIMGTNPFDPDTDHDGLGDVLELNIYKTDPLSIDTDGDGKKDGFELANGTDPNDPNG